jgi:hypothetical protein
METLQFELDLGANCIRCAAMLDDGFPMKRFVAEVAGD